MKITNQTVLITGGGAGIGFEVAKQLREQGNKVIITGRNKVRLQQAAAQLKNVSYIASDITNEADVQALAQQVQDQYSDLSILINNAAYASVYSVGAGAEHAYDIARDEMATNYLALIRLTETLLPVLKKQQAAAVVNVSSVVAFSPSVVIPTYSASKAAVHSYTQSLRHTLAKDTKVKVFELMPPLVNTEFSKEIGGAENGMPPAEVAQQLIEGLEKDEYEIYVGQTASFRQLFFSAPEDAFKGMNQGK